MGTSEMVADTIPQLAGRQQPVRLTDFSLGMNPMGLNRIEPRTLDRQIATEETDAVSVLLDLLIVCAGPSTHRVADMPRGIIPNQQQDPLAVRFEFGTTPFEKLRRDAADRTALDKAQPNLIRQAGRVGRRRDQQAVAGRRLGIGILFRDRLFHQMSGLTRFGPGVLGRQLEAAPPSLVLKPQGPVGVIGGETDRAVASAFFRVYSGSGLVIQRLARCHRTPKRASVARRVSPETRAGVTPCS